ncbi:Phosphoesterase, DHH family protein [Clostridiaceae bacterium JG1575]|nr:Phosphoesterase, DHH family protein [Clostridiaceae bacterium JG1575]
MDKYSRFQKEQLFYVALVLAALGWLIFLRQYLAAGVFLLLLIGVFLLLNRVHIFQRGEWDKFINDSVKKLKSSVVDAAVKAPFPLVAFTKDGTINWYNQTFRDLVAGEEGMPREIEEVLAVDPEKIWKSEAPEYIPLKGRVYQPTLIKYTAAQDEFEEDLLFLQLTDVTEVKIAEDRKVVLMLAEVDNLSEVLNSAPEDRRPFITAAIEKLLVDWVMSLKGTMKRYTNSKSILIAPYEVFRNQIKAKFPILDQIKAIELGNSIEPTLSIGVSFDNGDVMLDAQAAEQAKELALGRGGDQVVIKQEDKLTFFGGNSREVEKKSRVRSRVIAHALRDLMNESEHIYIMGHANPDMDSLGAAIGIHAIARSLGKNANILLDDPYRNVADLVRRVKEEPSYQNVFMPSKDLSGTLGPSDLLIVVDVHSLGYVLNAALAAENVRKVVIDHHRRAQDAITGATLNYIETYASSTAELVTELIQYIVEKPKLLKVEADALLSGIMVDTKNFYYKTGSRTFEAASFLRKSGANTLDIRELFSYDKELYLLKAAIIKAGEIEKGIAIAVCPSGIKDPLIAAQAADEFLNLKGITTSFVLVQDGADVVVSARSNGDTNVQVIMEQLGGGGHMTMSGARVKDADVDEVKARIKEILKTTVMEEDEDESDLIAGRQERR